MHALGTHRQHNRINVINNAGAACCFATDIHRPNRLAWLIKIQAHGQRSSQNSEQTGVEQAFRQGAISCSAMLPVRIQRTSKES